MRKINKKNVLNLGLALVCITLPMPKYNLNSQAIIALMLLWLATGNFNNKLKNLKLNNAKFLSVSIWFFLFLVGLTYTNNFEVGLQNIQKNLPLLAIPMVVFSTKWDWGRIKLLLDWLSISVVCCALFALVKASYFTYMGFGNYFYNQNLAVLLNAHTTYFALLCVLIILFFCYKILFIKTKIVYVIFITFLLGFLYLLSSRMGVFALGLGIFVVLFQKFSYKALIALIPIGAIIVGALFSPNFQKREIGTDEFGTVTPKLSTRFMHWQAVIDAVQTDNILIGASSGTNKNHVFNAYKNFGFTQGVLHRFNAHNQFLEYIIYFGLIAILTWVFCFWVWTKNLYHNSHPLLLSFFFVTMCFMITESILERQRGIVVFALFISLALSIRTNIIHEIYK